MTDLPTRVVGSGMQTEDRGDADVAQLSGMGADQTALDNTARQCEATGASLANGMAQLIGKIEDLGTGRDMQGASYRALKSVSDRLDDGLRTVVGALNDLAHKMSDAALKYGATASDASAEINSIGQSSGNSSISTLLRG